MFAYNLRIVLLIVCDDFLYDILSMCLITVNSATLMKRIFKYSMNIHTNSPTFKVLSLKQIYEIQKSRQH